MPDINDETSLKAIMTNITAKVIKDVGQKLYESLMENLDSEVYGNNINKVYERTGELKNSWRVISGNGLELSIEQDFSVMHSDPETFTHGSNYYTPTDSTEWVAYYINEGASGDIFGEGWWRDARPFLTETMELLKDGTLDEWITEAYAEYGIESGFKIK